MPLGPGSICEIEIRLAITPQSQAPAVGALFYYRANKNLNHQYHCFGMLHTADNTDESDPAPTVANLSLAQYFEPLPPPLLQ